MTYLFPTLFIISHAVVNIVFESHKNTLMAKTVFRSRFSHMDL